MVALAGVGDGTLFLSGHVAGAAVLGGRRGLADVEDLDAAVGPLPDLDGHVLRAEGAAHHHPAVLLVDQVALQLCAERFQAGEGALHQTKNFQRDCVSTSDLEERPSDPLVAPVAVDVHPQGHAVVLQSHSRHVIAFQVSKKCSARTESHRNGGGTYPVVHGAGGAALLRLERGAECERLQ